MRFSIIRSAKASASCASSAVAASPPLGNRTLLGSSPRFDGSSRCPSWSASDHAPMVSPVVSLMPDPLPIGRMVTNPVSARASLSTSASTSTCERPTCVGNQRRAIETPSPTEHRSRPQKAPRESRPTAKKKPGVGQTRVSTPRSLPEARGACDSAHGERMPHFACNRLRLSLPCPFPRLTASMPPVFVHPGVAQLAP